jgi:hypothetical protein
MPRHIEDDPSGDESSENDHDGGSEDDESENASGSSQQYESEEGSEEGDEEDDEEEEGGSDEEDEDDEEEDEEDDEEDEEEEDSDEESGEESEKFQDEDQFQHNSNIAVSDRDVEKGMYGDDPLRSPQDENANRKKKIMILGAVFVFLLIIGIVLGAVVFKKDDDKATPAAMAAPVAPTASPVTMSPVPTNTPSVGPTPLPNEFILDVVADTFVQVGTSTSQATSETLLVQNGRFTELHTVQLPSCYSSIVTNSHVPFFASSYYYYYYYYYRQWG